MPKKKDKGNKIFGSKLDPNSTTSPEILNQLLVELEKKGGFETEGIFRVSGSVVNVKKLKEAVEEGDKVDFNDYTVHDVAGLIKLYLRELQEPLFTFELYGIFIASAAVGDRVQINKALDLLPTGHRVVLQRLLVFLDKVVKLSKVNKMTAENLATCLVPNLLRPKTETMESTISDYPFTICLFASVIDNYEFYFKAELEEEKKKKDAIKEKALNYKKMMEQKYNIGGKKEEEGKEENQGHIAVDENHAPRPALRREETQEDLNFKKSMTLRYKTLNADTLKRLKDHESAAPSAMEFQAILEDQCQKIHSGDVSVVDIINLLQTPEKRSLPPTREPPAPPLRRAPATFGTAPSYRLSMAAEKSVASEEFEHDGGRSRSWTTLTSEVNPNDIKELLKSLPPLPSLDDLDEKLSTSTPPKPQPPPRSAGSFLKYN